MVFETLWCDWVRLVCAAVDRLFVIFLLPCICYLFMILCTKPYRHTPVFEPFVVPNGPIFKTFSVSRGAEIAQHGLKLASLHLFVYPK